MSHYHDAAGRPDKFSYGKMVIRNGWLVWRTRYEKPNINARLKWNSIMFLLISIKFLNVINTNKRKESFTEAIGRITGWISIIFDKPKA